MFMSYLDFLTYGLIVSAAVFIPVFILKSCIETYWKTFDSDPKTEFKNRVVSIISKRFRQSKRIPPRTE